MELLKSIALADCQSNTSSCLMRLDSFDQVSCGPNQPWFNYVRYFGSFLYDDSDVGVWSKVHPTWFVFNLLPSLGNPLALPVAVCCSQMPKETVGPVGRRLTATGMAGRSLMCPSLCFCWQPLAEHLFMTTLVEDSCNILIERRV